MTKEQQHFFTIVGWSIFPIPRTGNTGEVFPRKARCVPGLFILSHIVFGEPTGSSPPAVPATSETRAWTSGEMPDAVSVVVVGVGEPFVLVGSKLFFKDKEDECNSVPAALRRG